MRWTILRMAEAEMPSPSKGIVLQGNDTLPLTLACRTVAKAGAKLALNQESNETEVKVSWALGTSWLAVSCPGRENLKSGAC